MVGFVRGEQASGRAYMYVDYFSWLARTWDHRPHALDPSPIYCNYCTVVCIVAALPLSMAQPLVTLLPPTYRIPVDMMANFLPCLVPPRMTTLP